jgi:hypothetical protein
VTNRTHAQQRPAVEGLIGRIALATALLISVPVFAQQAPHFTPGNLVVAVSGCGVHAGTCTAVPNGNGTGSGNSSAGGYGDNQGSPLTLFQFVPNGTASAAFVNSLVLPQTDNGSNFPVSAEYGSSSEGTLQLSGSGKYLTIMGYGLAAATFNANPVQYGSAPSFALAQSGSLTGQGYTPVPRVVALIDSTGSVDSRTALYNIFNTNNPRSIYTQNGATAYVSGQGAGSDATGGVFYTALDITNTAPTAITGLDTTNNTLSQDTRDVQIINGTLYVSVDTKGGSNSARSYLGTLGPIGGPAPTTTVGAPVMLTGFGTSAQNGKVTITSGANSNGNGFNTGVQINVSPESYFFASPSILYVTDTGNSKQTSANSPVGDGGLQKWTNSKSDGTGTWSLAYTLYKGLGLVLNTSGSGSSGLYALAAKVSGSSVLLYATDYTLTDLDPTHLYGVTDTLSFTTATQAASETFALLASAPSDSNFKGVSFAPPVVTQITPTITWPAIAAVTFGSALSSEQLDATASVPGTFTYSPAAGTVLPAGANQPLSVTFTPTDTTDYTTTSAANSITVNPAAPATKANLVVTESLTRSGGNVIVRVSIANTGGTAATGVVLTSVKVGADAATVVPQSLGTIAPGATAVATVTVPGTVGASGAASSVSVSGTYTGSTFGGSFRATLP